MMPVGVYVVAAKVATLVSGGVVTYVAIRAFCRTGAPAMRAFAVGLGLVTLGSLLAGVGVPVFDRALLLSIAVQSTVTTVGFLVLAYSLYAAMDLESTGGCRGVDDVGGSSSEN